MELGKFGVTSPHRRNGKILATVAFSNPRKHEPEISVWRSLDERAMECQFSDQWWTRTFNAERVMATEERLRMLVWRTSSMGGCVRDRKTNLEIVPSGIVDCTAGRCDGSKKLQQR